ncbi:hypothetical protein CIHG_08750 [Coccidioides immitis H538.4]|uniref:Uncharacterized protein n=1 Tax=Coccidioides immitis H538.4 TaxID=396776 RepID=A0A0J8S0Y1_COCIT|nr:hypothetical protein CIHG_08750 [Coccidioides immitis H538.4]
MVQHIHTIKAVGAYWFSLSLVSILIPGDAVDITQESRSINDLSHIKIPQANVVILKDICDKAAPEHYKIWDNRLREAQYHLLNEKQQARS